MKRELCLLGILMAAAAMCMAQPDRPLLLRDPTLSNTHIVFSYAGDLTPETCGLWAGMAGKRAG